MSTDAHQLFLRGLEQRSCMTQAVRELRRKGTAAREQLEESKGMMRRRALLGAVITVISLVVSYGFRSFSQRRWQTR